MYVYEYTLGQGLVGGKDGAGRKISLKDYNYLWRINCIKES